jgi:DNA N-6-adenine-methyltransferase (Dam)
MDQPQLITESLTFSDLQRLQDSETIIERGMQTFYEVGAALLLIRSERLYRAAYGTFEEYCRDRWGFTAPYARVLIYGSEVYDNLKTDSIESVLPQRETHVRPLMSFQPDEQRALWQRAVETAPNGTITASHVQHVVNEYRGATTPPPPTAPLPMAVHYSSATPEWYTPPHIVQLAVDFFDEIDLDPCSNSHEAPNVPAGQVYTEEDDGLAQPWFGRVWLNPPYGDAIGAWVKKLHDDYQSGAIEAAIALLPGRIDTTWFDYVMPYAICRIRGRLKFVGADNSAPFPSVLVYYGDEIERFKEMTAGLGQVLTVYGQVPGDRCLQPPADE